MKSLFRYLKLILFYGIPFIAQATHVIGGSLTMTQLDKKPGKYRITLNILVNADHLVQNEDVLMLSEINYPRVVRKRDNLFMPVPKCTFEKFEELIYENPACEHTNGIHTVSIVM